MRWAWSRRSYRIQHKVISPLKLTIIRVSLVVALITSGLSPFIVNYLNPVTAHAANPYNASDVLGQLDQNQQPSFSQTSGGLSASGLNSPMASALDSANHHLFVADRFNNRVLVYSLDNTNQVQNQNASYVLGQPDFTSNSPASTQSGMNGPTGLALDVTNHQLYVADSNNNRVLIFNITSLSNGMNASNVLGQSNYTGSSPATTQSGFHFPDGMSIDAVNNHLYITDTDNFRVLVFNTTSLSNGMNASFVLGQPNFTSTNTTTSQNGMQQFPTGNALDVANSRLYVSDSTNSRVLVFNTTSLSNGMNASFVLGEPNFTTNSGGITTQSGMASPSEMTFDSINNRLYVADSNNDRVLIFNTTSLSNGMNANFVLGEPDFTTNNGGNTTQSGMSGPFGVTIDSTNNHLYVDDRSNNRVLVFNTTSLSNGMNATTVVGQNSFDTSTVNNFSPSATNLGYPQGTIIDTGHHRLFVVDDRNSRVLVYNLDTNNNLTNDTADYVLGQPDFTSKGQNTITQSSMHFPGGVAYDATNNRLFVADSNNNRVLVFNTTNLSNGMNASYVLGEPDFTTNNSATTQNSFFSLFGGMAYDPTTHYLYVSDSSSSPRVLVFNTTNLSNGMNASYVIGQPDFTSFACALTRSGLTYPYSMALDTSHHHLFVGDDGICGGTFTKRVLVYDTTALANGMNASQVLGQPDFVTGGGRTDQSAVGSPEDLAFDSAHQRLFTQDDQNNRVMVFDLSNGITNNMNAMGVLGQVDFASSDYSCVPSQSNQCDAEGLSDYYDTTNNRLYLSDSSNNRVLIFNFAKLAASSSVPTPTLTTPYSTNLGSQTQGTTTYAVTSGSLPPGLSLNTSSGVLSGIPTTAGTYTFSVSLADDNGTAGNYTDSASYSLVVSAASTGSSSASSTTKASSHKSSSASSVVVAASSNIILNTFSDFFSSTGVRLTGLTVGEVLHLCINDTSPATVCDSTSSNYHSITIKSIDLSTNSVTLTFVSSPFDKIFYLNQSADVSFNQDGTDNLEATLTNLTATTADFTFRNLAATKTTPTNTVQSQSTTTPNAPTKKANHWVWYAATALLLAMLATVLLKRKSKPAGLNN